MIHLIKRFFRGEPLTEKAAIRSERHVGSLDGTTRFSDAWAHPTKNHVLTGSITEEERQQIVRGATDYMEGQVNEAREGLANAKSRSERKNAKHVLNTHERTLEYYVRTQ